MKTVNREKLKRYLDEKGPGARELLAVKAKCSFSLIGRLLNGSWNAPKEATQIKISQVTGIPQNELFPEIEEEKPQRKERVAHR